MDVVLQAAPARTRGGGWGSLRRPDGAWRRSTATGGLGVEAMAFSGAEWRRGGRRGGSEGRLGWRGRAMEAGVVGI
jgi:hypothetical protein